MLIKLLEPHQGLKPGAEWNCPWAAVGRRLIADGKALALEECDRHLNPAPEAAGGRAGAPVLEKAKRPAKATRPK